MMIIMVMVIMVMVIMVTDDEEDLREEHEK